ncbi:hypothetical protein THAOC_08035 [Thalassiosira oceanica]|uniref:Uncharacterized protein n=1 Tax=Thalassiosira oceanica TaxID=159749 RepID=K0TJ37_THAOC|nr:hypothetical protein THAOC_08035 [Thalassiosira oceanica]|eukprot:EJK70592.1 hypothetical protein THAOC_08035 [Thalassiosira oceanica]
MEIEGPYRLGKFKWLYREPSARGSRNGPRKGRGMPAKRAFVEKLTAASVRKALRSATRDPRLPSNRVVQTNSRRGLVGMGRKVASWNRLVEIYKSLRIGARAVRAREEMRPTQPGGSRKKKIRGGGGASGAISTPEEPRPKNDGASAGGGREEEDTPYDAAVAGARH